MGAAYTVASKVAPVGRCRRTRVLTPRLADLFKPIIVSGAATHSINILRNKRMVVARQGKPIHVDRPFVTCISPKSEADAAPDGTSLGLHKVKQTADDDIGAGNGPRERLVQRRQRGGFYVTVFVEMVDLDRFHGCTDGDFARN